MTKEDLKDKIIKSLEETIKAKDESLILAKEEIILLREINDFQTRIIKDKK
jgi:hypothetical protein